MVVAGDYNAFSYSRPLCSVQNAVNVLLDCIVFPKLFLAFHTLHTAHPFLQQGVCNLL